MKGNLQYAGPEVLHQGCSNFPVHEQPYRLVVDRTAITSIVTWSDLLKLQDKKKIVGRLQKLQLENLALSVLELADFSDKARVLHERLAATDFENYLEHLKSLRNEIAHVKDIVRSDADLKTFVRRVEIAERWMGTLAGEKASSAAAP